MLAPVEAHSGRKRAMLTSWEGKGEKQPPKRSYMLGEMKLISLLAALGVFLIVSMVASVLAVGYPPEVTIVTVPSISGESIVGVLALTYSDGTMAMLSPATMTVRLCGTTSYVKPMFSCTTQTATINSDGTYSIDPIPTSMYGTVVVYVVAGSMNDSLGNTFPSVDTLLGTVTA